MVELESENETTKLSSKINVLNRNVKALMFSIDKLIEKNDKPVVEKTPEEEKEKMDKIFEKKNIGRPRGDYDSKREQYLKMLNENKIKQPKQQMEALHVNAVQLSAGSGSARRMLPTCSVVP